jgi:hypothetical protein
MAIGAAAKDDLRRFLPASAQSSKIPYRAVYIVSELSPNQLTGKSFMPIAHRGFDFFPCVSPVRQGISAGVPVVSEAIEEV